MHARDVVSEHQKTLSTLALNFRCVSRRCLSRALSHYLCVVVVVFPPRYVTLRARARANSSADTSHCTSLNVRARKLRWHSHARSRISYMVGEDLPLKWTQLHIVWFT